MKRFISLIISFCLIVTCIFAGDNNMNENARLENFFAKVRRGDTVTVATIGGSITTGFAANPANVKGWAGLTGQWLKNLALENNSKLSFYNRGVSGTDSAFGIARLEDHILSLKPDFVIVEYAMNDQWLDARVRQRTYESIIRKLLENPDVAVLALFVNERTAPYKSNQSEQQAICEYYGIPYVSWKDCLFAENPSADFESFFDGTEGIHPNNVGHAKIAEYITGKLNSIWQNLPADNKISEINKNLPEPKTDKGFESAKYYHMDNIEPTSNSGWKKGSPVHPEWVSHGNVHKGWETKEAGSEMTFEVTGTSVGITYCESDQFRDAIAWIEKEDGSIGQKIPLTCYQSIRKGYYGWAYKELINESEAQKYIVHVQCSKRAPKTAEGKSCNITGILVGGEK